jgi:Tol biopolymer transport system component
VFTAKIRGRALVVGAALALTTTTLAAGVAGASEPRGDAAPLSWILYQRDGDGRIEVGLIRGDATGLHNPVADAAGGDQSNPDWSPDGRRIVFAMSDGRRDDLWVADTDGGHLRMLLDCEGPCRWLDDPDWSPDGKRIVYSRTVRRPDGWGVDTLETVDVATGRVRVVLGPWTTTFTAGARYSPDGRRVVFERVHKVGRGPNSDVDGVVLTVVRLDVRSHPTRALTDPALFAATADWSPDGRRIVYSGLAGPDGAAPDLFLVRPWGGTPVRITDLGAHGGYANEPAWQADSRHLLFSGRVDGAGPPLLLRVRADGTGLGSAFGDDLVHGRHPRVQPTT